MLYFSIIGIIGAFQVNLKDAHKSTFYEVEEHDDSGIFRTKYNVLFINERHTHLRRTWTNHDYQQFADGAPVKGQHKIQSQHSADVHLKDGKVEHVHRLTKAFFRPPNGHHRAENVKDFQEQDIEITAKGHSRLRLRSCSDSQHQRSKRSTMVKEDSYTIRYLTRDTLVFSDTRNIKWSETGDEKTKVRPLYEVLRCFVDKSIKEREVADCSSELHRMVRTDKNVFQVIKQLVHKRNHQNITYWGVYVSALAAQGEYKAQNALAHALTTQYPRPLTTKEYETLLVSIHYLSSGPLHASLFNALFSLTSGDEKEDHITAIAMLVLAGLTERVETGGYNETLCASVADMIYNRYRNRSRLYHPDSLDGEMQLRDHIWAFGNLGHHSGLPVILRYIEHDDSSIRSAVILALRKMPQKYTEKHLIRALYQDEEDDVKAAVVKVFIDHHKDLSDSVVKGLEHALWSASEGEALDSAIEEFLENHGSHTKAVQLRQRRRIIHRRKRTLVPALRPREYDLGASKRWSMFIGGEWLGAEAVLQLANKLKIRIGSFGGKLEVNLDNLGFIRGHILKFPFKVVEGKAVFKAAATFKNDIPKDLIHTVADAGDDLLRQFDSVASLVTEQIESFRKELAQYIPLHIDGYTKFVASVTQFVKNLETPLQALKGTNKVMTFSSGIQVKEKGWNLLSGKITKIQYGLAKVTGSEKVFKKRLDDLNRIIGVIDGISKRLPKDLPKKVDINTVLQSLRGDSSRHSTAKIERYFITLGSSVPEDFYSQLLFKPSLHFSSSLVKLQDLLSKLQYFSNSFLDISFLLNSFEDGRLLFWKVSGSESDLCLIPTLKRSPKCYRQLKLPDFQNLIRSLVDVGNFFSQFTNVNFDLETFFRGTSRAEMFNLRSHFPAVSLKTKEERPQNFSDPMVVLQLFLSSITDDLDENLLNVSLISNLTDFYHEIGPTVTQFAEQSLQKMCSVHKTAMDYSREFSSFDDKIGNDGFVVLDEMKNTSENILKGFLNLTVLVDTLTEDLEREFFRPDKGFLSDLLQELAATLRDIQNLSDDVLDLANSTSLNNPGLCCGAVSLSTDIINKVQISAKQGLNNLFSFTGTVATKLKASGADLKTATSRLEVWHKTNLAHRVGDISRVAQILSDFLSTMNKETTFHNSARELATRLNEVLKHLKNLPDYAIKAREAVDNIAFFADGVHNYQDEMRKLTIQGRAIIEFDQTASNVCDKFNDIPPETFKVLKCSELMQEISKVFTEESSRFIDKVSSGFRNIKLSVNEIRGEVKEISSMAVQVMATLTDFKPFAKNVSLVLATAEKLPDCQQLRSLFLDSTKPCVRTAFVIGKSLIDQYISLTKEIKVLKDLLAENWKNLKTQKCFKGGTCFSKAFMEQGKIIRNKVDLIKDRLKKALEYNDMVSVCEDGLYNMIVAVDVMKRIFEQFGNFSLTEDFQRVMKKMQRLTGRNPENSINGPRRRFSKDEIAGLEVIANYKHIVKELEKKVHLFQENTFQGLRSVHDNVFLKYGQSLQSARFKLQLAYQLWQKTKHLNSILKTLNTGAKEASAFAEQYGKVTSLLSNPTVKLLSDIAELTSEVKPQLLKNKMRVTKTVDKINGFMDKVSDFLNQIQTSQRGLDPSTYKPWQDMAYCSKDVCLRSLGRSAPLYLSTTFSWKFPHLDYLSSMPKSGRWLTPGLFDDYKAQGISQLSDNEMILGMHGVASNKGKAPLLVVTNFHQGVKKIIQLTRRGQSLPVKIGGVAIARDHIWISDSSTNEILSIEKSRITSTFSSRKPSKVEISKAVTVKAIASSVSYDEQTNILWVTSRELRMAYGYKLTANGDLSTVFLTPSRVIHVGENAQGFAIVRQFGNEYACISKYTLVAGFQCKLEFHDLSKGDTTGKNSLSRVVRTPSGLESVTRIDNEVIAVAFSSGTFAEKEHVELVGGDYEDRYFKLRLPILRTIFQINQNCLYLSVRGDHIGRPRRIFPTGELLCGKKRKRSIFQEQQETDIYQDKLEEIHKTSKRDRRNIVDPDNCTPTMEESLLPAGSVTFFDASISVPVFGIPVSFFAGIAGHYKLGYQATFCRRSKVFKLGLIPGAWISVKAGVSISLLIIKVGVTVEARLLETYLVPELRIEAGMWPLQTCITIRQHMTPLSIRVYLWLSFRTIKIDVWIIGISISFPWGSKKTLMEWSWSANKVNRIVYDNCEINTDRTPPDVGTCTARQAADTKYFVQWHGFREDTKISAYHIRIGSIEGSGDDYASWVDTSLSHITDLQIMHGRNVFVSVMAMNEERMDSRLAYCPRFQAWRKRPQIGFVYDGILQGTDFDYQYDTYSIGMNFEFKSDVNDIVNLKWGVSSHSICTFDESESDVVPMTSLGDSNSIQTSGLSLRHNVTYFVRLHALNRFGLRAFMCSNGVLIDTTPPIPVSFQDGGGKGDVNFLPSLKRVRGKFKPFIDHESPMVKYEWKIVSNVSGKNVTPFVNIPLSQQTPLMEGIFLEAGTPYRLVLRGTNAVGLYSVIESNGFIPDSTAPNCEESVIDVTKESEVHDVDFAKKLENIQAKWKCFDRESGIFSQIVGVGTYPGGDDVKAFKEFQFLDQNDRMSYISFTNITIVSKVRYHVTIKVINGAGLKKTIFSDGILIDTTPPTVVPSYIKDGEKGKDLNFTSERFVFKAH